MNERFEELWNDYLEGELDESGVAELRALVEADDRQLREAADSYQLHRLLGLAAQDRPSRQEDFVHATMERLPADKEHFTGGVMHRLPQQAKRPRLAPMAVAAIVLLLAGLYIQGPGAERDVARITGLSGYLQWTGDGGRVIHDLSVGTKLTGGTIAGMTPNSWFELSFNDGSTVTISGNSTLTFSEHDQKELHLKEGNLSANVQPQPAGRPMLVHTRSALLEVVGTQFDVEAELTTTVLNVNEGKVRVKRLSDGSTIEVPARHRAIAAVDRKMQSVAVDTAVNRWKSHLQLGPEGMHGKWIPATDTEVAKLKAVPYGIKEGFVIYTAAFGISEGDSPPVIMQPGSRFKVHGRITSSTDVWFGVTVRHPNGEFAGRFQIIQPATEFKGGETFEVSLSLGDFALDPLLNEYKDYLPPIAYNLEVESMWCHTLDKQVGLEIISIELVPPDATLLEAAKGYGVSV
jgi:hypothetical protein